MTQLRLPLGTPEGEGGFIVSESNIRAVQQLEHWGSWPVMAAVIAGPPQSGKSLLARIMAAKSGGRVIDDADQADEAELFHAWNAAQATRHPLFLTARTLPPTWNVALPDLRSRLGATPVVQIGPPDDDLVEMLFAQMFEQRELLAKPDLIVWLARRAERSHATMIRIVDALERDATERGTTRLSIPAARATLSEQHLLIEMKD